MDLTASRVVLALLWASLLIVCWALTVGIERKRVWRSVSAVGVTIIAIGLDYWAPKPKVATSPIPARTHELRLAFMESPIFTEERRQRISDEMDRLYHYFIDLGLDVPVEVIPSLLDAGRPSPRF